MEEEWRGSLPALGEPPRRGVVRGMRGSDEGGQTRPAPSSADRGVCES